MPLHPAAKELLVGLAKLGARSTAAALDVALEEAQDLVGEWQTRIGNGRRKAQKISKKPRENVKVSVAQTDARGVDVEAEVMEEDE
jgi:hypothetical protein